MKPLRRNTEAELDAFERVCLQLNGFDGRVGAEWADGWLTALALMLRPPPFDDWVGRLAGDAFERAFADPEDRERARAALEGRLAVLLNMLDAESLDEAPDSPRLVPLLNEWTDEDRTRVREEEGLSDEEEAALVTGAEWAEGFFAGMADLGEDAWPQPADDAQAETMTLILGAVHALRLPDGSEAMRQHLGLAPGDACPDRDALLDDALFAVQDMKLWMVDNAPRPVTRHVDKPPGRNDPCPCGSGKKYKKCHGAS